MKGHHENFLEERGLTSAEQDLWFAIDSYEHGMRPVWEGGVDPSTGEEIEAKETDLTDPRQLALHEDVMLAAKMLGIQNQISINSTVISKIHSVPDMEAFILRMLVEQSS